MKKLLLLPIIVALLACSNQGKVDNTEKDAVPDTAALVQRVNDIYADAFNRYGGGDKAVPDVMATADSLYCSRDWKDLTSRVERADSALAAEGMIGFFDSDYWIMGQDWDDLSVSDVRIIAMTDSTATAELNLHNCGSVTVVRLDMVLEDDVWKIDNFVDASRGVDWKANMKDYLKDNK